MTALSSAARALGFHSRQMRRRGINAIADVRRRLPSGGVALTFDDGPHPVWTNGALDILADLGVVATFFCVGRNAQRYPDVLRRALTEGHAVGSHSLSHPPAHKTSIRRLSREYGGGRRLVSQVAGADVRLFRPPYGYLSVRSAAVVRSQRLRTWMWTVDPEDWQAGSTAEGIAAVAGAAKEGDVVLLHDWVEEPWAAEARDRSATLAALPDVVHRVRERGLEFVRLPV
jgi:peptidoglycan-N-acetylglucosamine deacetylase